jgi:hypothetical protein
MPSLRTSTLNDTRASANVVLKVKPRKAAKGAKGAKRAPRVKAAVRAKRAPRVKSDVWVSFEQLSAPKQAGKLATYDVTASPFLSAVFRQSLAGVMTIEDRTLNSARKIRATGYDGRLVAVQHNEEEAAAMRITEIVSEIDIEVLDGDVYDWIEQQASLDNWALLLDFCNTPDYARLEAGIRGHPALLSITAQARSPSTAAKDFIREHRTVPPKNPLRLQLNASDILATRLGLFVQDIVAYAGGGTPMAFTLAGRDAPASGEPNYYFTHALPLPGGRFLVKWGGFTGAGAFDVVEPDDPTAYLAAAPEKKSKILGEMTKIARGRKLL